MRRSDDIDWRNGARWYYQAFALKRAANKIRETYLVASNDKDILISKLCNGESRSSDKADITDLDQFPIAVLLAGYAVENIVRGIIICGTWLESPELVGMEHLDELYVDPKKGTHKLHLMEHNLRRLLDAKAMTVDFLEDEKAVMDILDEFIRWAGRYPFPKQYDPSDLKGLRDLRFIMSSYPVIDSIYVKGMEELDRLCQLQRSKLNEAQIPTA
jgi:hypothetical protein